MNVCCINCVIIIFGYFVSQTVESTKLINQNGRTLVVVTKFDEPFMMLRKDRTNRKNETMIPSGTLLDPSLVEGYCADLARVICDDKLKLPYKFHIETSYGREVEKGAWSGIMGALVHHEADLSIAPLVITAARNNAVNFSKPFLEFGVSIMIRKPQKDKSNTYSLLKLSSIEIVFTATIFYIFVRIYVFLLSRSASYLCRFEDKMNGTPSSELSMLDGLFLSLSVFLHRSVNILPRSLPERVTKGAYCGFIIIVLLLFASMVLVFIRFATTPQYISTVEDLAKQTKIRYGTIRNSSTMTFFNASTYKIYKDMWSFMELHKDNVFVSSNREGLEKVRQSNGKYAFIAESTYIDYANERLPCETMRLGENLNTNGFGIATPLGSDLREIVGQAVLEMKQNGFLETLRRKWYYERSECRNGAAKDFDQTIKSRFLRVITMFYILIIAMAVAIIITVLEFMVKTKLRSNRIKLNSRYITS